MPCNNAWHESGDFLPVEGAAGAGAGAAAQGFGRGAAVGAVGRAEGALGGLLPTHWRAQGTQIYASDSL